MKCLMIILLSIIRCHSINETFPTKTSNNNNNSSSFSPVPNPPYFLPLQMMAGLFNESNLESHEAYPQQTQPHQTLPKTTLSRVVETKYGKIQGLSVTLCPSSEQQASNNNNNRNAHPLRNKMVEVYLSVPYASPPIKSNRFSPTQAPIPWDGIRKVIKPGFVCPQVMPDIRDENAALKEMPKGYLDYLRRVEPYLRNQSEDCLYLNIFSPAAGGPFPSPLNLHELHTRLKPVLVFVHGGKFSWGSGNLYDGTLLAAYSEILVVTLNYRLGILGFLNMNPSTKPLVANFGLMDQIAALHWIKENIVLFGGDPENVTMMGYEAGAACIHFLMSSPAVVPGLFHRSILIAGSSKAPWALVEDPFTVASSLAGSLNCSVRTNNTATNSSTTSTSTFNSFSAGAAGRFQILERERDSSLSPLEKTLSISDSLSDCLKNKHFSYFTKFLPPKFAVDFGPTVDGVVILPTFWTTSESQPGKRAVGKKYDLLFGLSASEMAFELGEADLVLGVEPPRRDAILRTLVRNSYRFHLNEILATVSNEYVDWERNVQHPVSARDLTINAVTDCLSLAPVIAASESVQIQRSYFYVFEHSTKSGLYTFQKSGGTNGEELNYFFGLPLVENILPFFPSPLPSNYTKTEMALSEMLINYASNFVHSGDPNEPNKGEASWPISKEKNKFKSTIWEPYDRLHQKYLELTANRIRIRSHYRAHQMAVWLRLVPELQRSGAQYASILHNQMKGGYDSLLYVGRLRLPEELAIANHYSISDNSDFGDLYFNGSGIHPSPPTTCFSSLSSISSGHGNANVGAVAVEEMKYSNSTGPQPPFMSHYATALTVTIAIGCSLLILNVFIFALLYYRRDKKRAVSCVGGNSSNESQQLNNHGEPLQLLKSTSTTTAASFHHSVSESSFGGNDDQYQQHHFHNFKDVNFGPSVVVGPSSSIEMQGGSMMSSGTVEESGHDGNFNVDAGGRIEQELLLSHHPQVHFSHNPSSQRNKQATTVQNRQSNHYQPHVQQQQQQLHHNHLDLQQQHVCVNMEPIPSSPSQQPLGVSTLPLQHRQQSNSVKSNSSAAVVAGRATATLPKKPVPPTRNATSSYTITQRQIFSVIMTLVTFGIL